MVFSPEENFRDLSGFEVRNTAPGRKFQKNLVEKPCRRDRARDHTVKQS